METIYLGVNIAKNKFDVVLLQADRYQHKVFTKDKTSINALIIWLSNKVFSGNQLHVVMEATGNYHLVLVCVLVKPGIKVSVKNPSKLNAFAKACL